MSALVNNILSQYPDDEAYQNRKLCRLAWRRHYDKDELFAVVYTQRATIRSLAARRQAYRDKLKATRTTRESQPRGEIANAR